MLRALLLVALLIPGAVLAAPPASAPASIAVLIDRLRDADPGVRAEAARSLGEMRAREALRPLQVLAQTDFDDNVRRAAAEAVHRIDARAFAAKLATGELPPVRPAPPAAPAVEARRPAIVVAASAVLNALRAGDSAAAQVGAALRWRSADVQLSLAFPALSLFGQLRVNLLAGRARLVPYLTAGWVIAYNNGTGRHPTISLAGGGGARLRLRGPLQIFAEVLANVVLLDSLPPDPALEARTVAMPIVLGLALEL